MRALSAPAALALATVRLGEQKRRLEYALATDPLTGLFNRRYLDARLDEEIGRAARSATSLALLALDVDRFKSLNDTGGTPWEMPCCEAWRTCCAAPPVSSIFCARVGGDKFAVLLPGTDGVSGVHTAERIRTRVETSPAEADFHGPRDDQHRPCGDGGRRDGRGVGRSRAGGPGGPRSVPGEGRWKELPPVGRVIR